MLLDNQLPSQEIPCCDIFTPYYVMLRGRCLRLNRTIYQMDPSDVGRIDVYMVNKAKQVNPVIKSADLESDAKSTDGTDGNAGNE